MIHSRNRSELIADYYRYTGFVHIRLCLSISHLGNCRLDSAQSNREEMCVKLAILRRCDHKSLQVGWLLPKILTKKKPTIKVTLLD